MSRLYRLALCRPRVAAAATAGLTLRQRAAVLGTVLLTSVGLLVALQTGSARAATHPVLDLRDTFVRSVAHGFGTAQRGGTWAVDASTRRTHFAVGDGRGTIGPVPAGHSAAAALHSVRVANQRLRVLFRLPHEARRGGGTQLALNLRHVAGGNAYRATLRVRTNGTMAIWLTRYHHHVGRRIGRIRTFSGALHGRAVVLEAAVTGHFRVLLQARAWVRGHRVPNWQVRYADRSGVRIDQPGSVGVAAYNTRNTAAAQVTVDSLRGWLTPPRVGHGRPGGPSSSTPTSSAPTSAAPTSESPTTSSSSAPSSSSSAPSSTSSAPTSSSPSSSSSAPSSSSSAPTSSSPAPSSSSSSAPPPVPDNPDRGSLPVGSAVYPVPSGALFVSSSSGSDSNPGTQAQPLQTVKAAVRAASSGQTIVLRAGTYHEDVFVTAGKQLTIENYPGEAVWFDGSVPVTNWTKQGSTWVSTGWTAQFDHSASFTKGSDAGGFVNANYPMAAWPDQVFVDGSQLDQVAAGTTPGAGQFAVDYNADTITIGSDPSGHSVRASNLEQAFVVAGTVTLRGFGVRRYATPLPDMGTVFLGGTDGGSSLLQNLVIEDNATQGFATGVANTTVDHCTTNDNGMTGMMANTANNLVIQNSVLDGNNTQHFNSAPSAAGMKIGRTNGVVIKNNEVEHNVGVDGIWTDISTSNFKIVDNTVADNNDPYGIITELSDGGIVADNTVSGARYGYTAFDTGDVQIYNNSFSGNSVWDIGASQDERRNTDPATKGAIPWLVRNLTVSDNLYGSSGSFQFYALDKATHIPASSMNIVINGNAFPSPTNAVMVGWGGSDNTTVTYYRTPDALNAGLHVSWDNVLLTSGSQQKDGDDDPDAAAVPLPADVANAIGVPAGTKHIGTF